MITSQYLLLLPLIVLIYTQLRLDRTRHALLILVAAIIFLASGIYDLVIISLLLSITWFGIRISEKKLSSKKIYLIALIALEITPLLIYKFLKLGWFHEALAEELNLDQLSSLIPPLGLSILTFQAISYTVDRFQNKIHQTDFFEFLVYMTFFPHLVAGPILKASEFIPQLSTKRVVSESDLNDGIWRIFCGLFKKLVLADLLAKTAIDPVFLDSGAFSSLEILIALYAYTIQIYLDFSAYTDVVIGSALLLGYKIPENFNQPYRVHSIAEYWRRWHMSLSNWVMHYVYFPLGGSRGVGLVVYRNVFICILLLAIWHGITINFILYGTCHATAVCINRWARKQEWWIQLFNQHPVVLSITCWLLVFNFIVFSRILFRNPDLESALNFIDNIQNSDLSGSPRFSLIFWLALCGGCVICFINMKMINTVRNLFNQLPYFAKGLLFALVLMAAAYLSSGDLLNFIYRNF